MLKVKKNKNVYIVLYEVQTKKIYVRTYGALKLIIYRLYPKNLKSSDKNFLSNCVLKNIRKNETILVKGSQILKKPLMALQAFDAIQFYLYRNRL